MLYAERISLARKRSWCVSTDPKFAAKAAESRISDVDVAIEMIELVRTQVLADASLAILAQANSLPRLALSLIEDG